jgi:hypothetical protein
VEESLQDMEAFGLGIGWCTHVHHCSEHMFTLSRGKRKVFRKSGGQGVRNSACQPMRRGNKAIRLFLSALFVQVLQSDAGRWGHGAFGGKIRTSSVSELTKDRRIVQYAGKIKHFL